MGRPKGQKGGVRLIDGTWYGFYKHPETKVRRKVEIGPKSLGKSKAERKLIAMLDSRVNAAKELPLAPTLENIWDAYKRRYAERSTGHAVAMNCQWNHISPVFGKRLAADIAPEEIEAFFKTVRTKQGKPFKAFSLRKMRELLSQLLRRAARSKVIEFSPMVEVTTRFKSDHDPTAFSLEQVRAIRAQLPTEEDRIKFDLFAILGLSKSEARALRCDDVSFDGLRIDENRVYGKSGATKVEARDRTLPLPAALLGRLTAIATGEPIDWLFRAERGDGPWCAKAWLCDTLRPAATRAGIGYIDLRKLRRTTNTNILKRTGDPTIAAGILRNSVRVNQEHYSATQNREENLAALVDWEAAITEKETTQ